MLSSIPTIIRLFAAGAALSILSVAVAPTLFSPAAEITLETTQSTAMQDELFLVDVRLQATQPINVFKGIVTFDPTILSIESIDYNTSVADLWAEEPWYSNGDGTLTFIGGTTRTNGFTGDESIVRITFKGSAIGTTAISIRDIEVLLHDGLGTFAATATPIDAIFTIAPETRTLETISRSTNSEERSITVIDTTNNTDLNNDGKQNIIDSSIFMTHLASQNLRSDFNQDGVVNLQDLSIMNKK